MIELYLMKHAVFKEEISVTLNKSKTKVVLWMNKGMARCNKANIANY